MNKDEAREMGNKARLDAKNLLKQIAEGEVDVLDVIMEPPFLIRIDRVLLAIPRFADQKLYGLYKATGGIYLRSYICPMADLSRHRTRTAPYRHIMGQEQRELICTTLTEKFLRYKT